MTSTTLDLSIVIVAWNVGDLLAGCLRSLSAGLGDVQAEIIVVDNGSIDDTVRVIRAEFPHVTVLPNAENIGVNRARNLAVRLSQARYVLFLDADTVVLPDTVPKLLWFMDSTSHAGVAGCKQVYPGGQPQSTCHRMISLKREAMVALGLTKLFRGWVDYGDLPLKATQPLRVDWVGLACLIVRRNLLTELGDLDENIWHHGDDVDLCQCVRNLGSSVYYLPDAVVVHHRGQSGVRASELAASTDYSRLRSQFTGRKYVIKKHYGTLSANIYQGFIIVEVIRKLVQNSLGLLIPQPHSSRRALARALREYLAVLNAAVKGGL